MTSVFARSRAASAASLAAVWSVVVVTEPRSRVASTRKVMAMKVMTDNKISVITSAMPRSRGRGSVGAWERGSVVRDECGLNELNELHGLHGLNGLGTESLNR